jgi:hypothetical protein
MGDPNQPKPPRKGQFQKGNKFAKGRPKGAENKFGPGFREKLLAGIIASGEKKARKNGVNGKIDGFSYFVESLVDGNGGAAATLIAKMLPSEAPPPKPVGPGITVNISSVAEGQQFSPGTPDLRILMPFDEAGACWTAYHGGCETWAAYLIEVEGHLTRKAFENLSRVPPLERAKFLPDEAPSLHLVPKAPADTLEAQLGAQLDALPREELLSMTVGELMARAGVDPKHIGPDDAA